MRTSLLAVLLVLGSAAGGVQGREILVDRGHPLADDSNPGTPERPLRTIAKGAEVARAGDTVVVKAGVYRESVILTQDGAPNTPIVFLADPIGSVTITGADPLIGWERVVGEAPIYRVPWRHRFVINTAPDGTPIEHHPEDAPVWGRAEQVIVDGFQMVPTGDLEALSLAYQEMGRGARRDSAYGATVPDPRDPQTWRGAFFADTENGFLYLCLADGSDPSAHQVLASTRGLLFGTDPWRDRGRRLERPRERIRVSVWGHLSPASCRLALRIGQPFGAVCC
ncbi:MAG: hypothetical protein KatS3mg115_1762 [Candidatus Poribacteria bacterium]|nr:MAG: hypothetical protein KatS3mg115_1762 [Candidatus Poribacteria bacterium]